MEFYKVGRIRTLIETTPRRNKLEAAAVIYAIEILQNVQELPSEQIAAINNVDDFERALLNGAANWNQYCEDGYALICWEDIRARVIPNFAKDTAMDKDQLKTLQLLAVLDAIKRLKIIFEVVDTFAFNEQKERVKKAFFQYYDKDNSY